MTIALGLLALAAHAVAAQTTPALPSCEWTQTWGEYDKLVECLDAAPINMTDVRSAVTSLRRMSANYVFADQSRDGTGTGFPEISVDLDSELAAVEKMAENGTISKQHELHEALADVFVPLRDAHTRYNKPAPFSNAVFTLPFTFSANWTVDGGDEVFMHPQASFVAAYKDVYNKTLPRGVDGARVVKIDGQAAGEAVLEYARTELGYSKDVGSRFSLAVIGYGNGLGYFTYRSQVGMKVPTRPDVAFEVERADGTTATFDVKWLAAYNETALPTAEVDVVRAPTQLDDMQVQATRLLGAAAPAADSSYYFEQINEDVGLLRIGTFGPGDMHDFAAVIQDGLASRTGSKLVIDLRANGGGDICLGYATLRALFPSLGLPKSGAVQGRYDMRASPLLKKMAGLGAEAMCTAPGEQDVCGEDPEEVGYMTPCAWYAASETGLSAVPAGAQFADDSFLTPGVERTRGGITGTYSLLVHEGCQYRFDDWTTPGAAGQCLRTNNSSDTPPAALYDPDNLMLLSDGMCGSTCAVFSSFILMHGLGKSLVVGGSATEQAQQFWSFPGGEVETISYLRTLAEKYGMDVDGDELIPAKLPWGATARFAIREIYPWDTTSLELPLEFRRVPAHFHRSMLGGRADVDVAIELLGACVAGVGGAECTGSDGGTGRVPCIDGQWDTSKCDVTDCPGGKYIEPGTGTCSPCPKGFYRTDDDNVVSKCRKCRNADVIASDNAFSYTDEAVTSSDCPFRVKGVFNSKWSATGVVIGVSLATGVLSGGLVFYVMRRRAAAAAGDMSGGPVASYTKFS